MLQVHHQLLPDGQVAAMGVYEDLGVRPVINARGCSTIIGGTLMSDAVLDAMRDAARAFVRISDLQQAAGDVIARATGAEAGYVTNGAAAGIALSTAAVLSGVDTARINALPETGDKNEVLIQRLHRNPYDHLVRAAGARLVEFGTGEGASDDDLNEATTDRTVAVFFSASREHKGGLSCERLVAITRDRGLPVIVDASMSLPPASNLRRFVTAGADLVCFSGGKAIRGPQASGFIACDEKYLVALALHHQDLDVAPATWIYRDLLEQGLLDAVPDQGIGRSMKVGKEEIAGLVRALRDYVERDHEAELAGWHERVDILAGALAGVRGLTVAKTELDGRPVPVLAVSVDPVAFGMAAVDAVHALASRDLPVVVDDHAAVAGILRFNPENLYKHELDTVIESVVALSRRE